MSKKLAVVSSFAFVAALSSSALAERPAFFIPRADVPRMDIQRPTRESPIQRERMDRPTRESRPVVDRPAAERVDPHRDRPTPEAKQIHEVKQDRTACHPGSAGCGEARADESQRGSAAGEGRVPAIVRRIFSILDSWKARAREE